MSTDFLHQLTARTLNLADVLQPAPAPLFAPELRVSNMFDISAVETVEQDVEVERSDDAGGVGRHGPSAMPMAVTQQVPQRRTTPESTAARSRPAAGPSHEEALPRIEDSEQSQPEREIRTETAIRHVLEREIVTHTVEPRWEAQSPSPVRPLEIRSLPDDADANLRAMGQHAGIELPSPIESPSETPGDATSSVEETKAELRVVPIPALEKRSEILPAANLSGIFDLRSENPPAEAPATPPSIRVTIGRIEVRAVFPPATPAKARQAQAKPGLSLEEYLKEPRRTR